MDHPSDILIQLAHDRQQALRGAAAVHRLVPSTPVRTRLALTLRRAADRLDAATVSPSRVGSAIPGGGC